MGLLLTGRRISTAWAHELGLVSEVVPRAELDDAVQRWVDEIKACAPLSVRAIKEMVNQAQFRPPEEAARLRLPVLIRALQSEDAKEGVKAFQEKRAPRWRAQ
jgi:crotonobetainyl-CoA hydratase